MNFLDRGNGISMIFDHSKTMCFSFNSMFFRELNTNLKSVCEGQHRKSNFFRFPIENNNGEPVEDQGFYGEEAQKEQFFKKIGQKLQNR